jgi:hypothetical protein
LPRSVDRVELSLTVQADRRNISTDDSKAGDMTQHLISPTEAMTISGVDGLEACWALDRFTHPNLGLTRVGLLLGRAKVGGLGPAGVALGERMGEVARRRALPDDIVIAAVPSSGDLTADMAARVGSALGRPVERLLGVRGGLLGRLDGSVRGRIKAKTRSMPRHVLLVDDSVRSGDTLKACAQLVRHRGAEQVWAVVAAAMLDFDGADPISW